MIQKTNESNEKVNKTTNRSSVRTRMERKNKQNYENTRDELRKMVLL
jgi:hypothetical protein